MSKHIEWENPDYIVNLTKQLVGERAVGKLRIEFRHHCPARALYCYWQPQIAVRVEVMNSETLGRIAAYGTTLGAHSLDANITTKPKFISRTGMVDLFSRDEPCFFNGNPAPRAMLEMLAVATIICVLRDIILQSKWSDEWNKAHDPGWESIDDVPDRLLHRSGYFGDK